MKSVSMSMATGLMMSLAQPATANLSVAPLTPASNVFAGRKAHWRYSVQAREDFSGRAAWRLAVGDRTLARREQPVAAGFGRDGAVNIELELPAAKPGVVLSATLTVALLDPDGKERTRHEKDVLIFAEDAFSERQRWLRDLKIHLFDPEGKTSEIMTAAGIPFTPVVNMDAFDSIASGLLLIGEGVSLRDYRGLWPAMTRTAARGLPVLCLALSAGEFELPTTDTDSAPRAERMVLRQNNVVTDMDKRLDPDAWPPDGRSVASSLALSGGRGSIDANVQANRAGWPWLELGFAHPARPAAPTRLAVCGFAIMEKWNDSPTPRYLFVELLNYVTENNNNQQTRRSGS
jgi:hypothetical protein